MTKQIARRDTRKGGTALVGLAVFGIPEWSFPALAQGEAVVPCILQFGITYGF